MNEGLGPPHRHKTKGQDSRVCQNRSRLAESMQPWIHDATHAQTKCLSARMSKLVFGYTGLTKN